MVGSQDDLLTETVELTQRTWVQGPLPVGAVVLAQASAHGRPRPVTLTETGVRYLDGPVVVSRQVRRSRSTQATRS